MYTPNRNERREPLGSFTVTTGQLRITDPCYDPQAKCAIVTAALNGTWLAETILEGAMVKALRIHHESKTAEVFEGYDGSRFSADPIGIGVDSGQVGCFDAGRYPDDPEALEYADGTFYMECCNLTLDENRPGGGVLTQGFGAVSSTAYGDGEYRCYLLKNAEGQVIAAYIDFIGVEDSETDEYEEEASTY